MKYLPALFIAFALVISASSQTPPAPEYLRIEAEQAQLSGGAKVMTDHTGYSGQGFVAGFESAGASARVSVGVPASGTAEFSLRYSAGWGPETVGLYVDGQKAAELRLLGTKGWDDWATANASIQLAAGMRTVEIRRDRGDTGTINIDWIGFALAKGLVAAGQAVFEAEDGILGGSAKVAFDHSDFSGRGFVAGFENAGASVRLPMTIAASCSSLVSIRYSAGYGDQVAQLYVDDRKIADLRLQGTAGWDSWKSLELAVPLEAGPRVLEIRRDSRDTGVINIDKVTVSGAARSSLPAGGIDQAGKPSALDAVVGLEAELCALSGSAKVETDHSGFTGLGFVAGFGDLGASIRFSLPARQDGLATITIRYSAGYGDETVGIYVDGKKAADLRCARTSGWDSWSAASVSFPLGKGTHLVEIRRDRQDTGLINVDSMTFR